ncbi:MAG: hypothetical protein Q4G04_02640 [bacterium]|nr:hypothetical protein [bacterium]
MSINLVSDKTCYTMKNMPNLTELGEKIKPEFSDDKVGNYVVSSALAMDKIYRKFMELEKFAKSILTEKELKVFLNCVAENAKSNYNALEMAINMLAIIKEHGISLEDIATSNDYAVITDGKSDLDSEVFLAKSIVDDVTLVELIPSRKRTR